MDSQNRDLVSLISVILRLIIIRQFSKNLKSVQLFLREDSEEGAFNFAIFKVFAILFTFTSSSRTYSPLKESLCISTTTELVSATSTEHFSFILSHVNTFQGIISVVNSLRPRLVSCRKY